jgi:hypothetical protein
MQGMRTAIPVAPQPYLTTGKFEAAAGDAVGIGHEREAGHQQRIGIRAWDCRTQHGEAAPAEFANRAPVRRIEHEADVRVPKQHEPPLTIGKVYMVALSFRKRR